MSIKKDYDFWKKEYSVEEIQEYIEKYPENLDWYFWHCISKYQTLSGDFIREFEDKVNWYNISKYQIISEGFLIEFIEKVEIKWLLFNKNIPEDVKNRIINLKKVIDQ